LSIFLKSTWEAYGYFETIYYLDKDNKIMLIFSDIRYAYRGKKWRDEKCYFVHSFARTGDPTSDDWASWGMNRIVSEELQMH
jgi:hypothetical protein